MDTRQQKNKTVSSDEWYTPKWMIDALGPFDLDPCSPKDRPFDTATVHWTKEQDGLLMPWGKSFVWLNPPYSRQLLRQFVEKLAQHNNGIALLINRQDNLLFQEVIFPKATSMLFMRHRVKFLHPDGRTSNPPTGHCLVAFGRLADQRLRDCRIEGKYVRLNPLPSSLDNVPGSAAEFILSKSAGAGTFNSQQAVVPVADVFTALKMQVFQMQTDCFSSNMRNIMEAAAPADFTNN